MFNPYDAYGNPVRCAHCGFGQQSDGWRWVAPAGTYMHPGCARLYTGEPPPPESHLGRNLAIIGAILFVLMCIMSVWSGYSRSQRDHAAAVAREQEAAAKARREREWAEESAKRDREAAELRAREAAKPKPGCPGVRCCDGACSSCSSSRSGCCSHHGGVCGN